MAINETLSTQKQATRYDSFTGLSKVNKKISINVPVTTPPKETYGYLPDSYKNRWLRSLDKIAFPNNKAQLVWEIFGGLSNTAFGSLLSLCFESTDIQMAKRYFLSALIVLIVSISIYCKTMQQRNQDFSKEKFIIDEIKLEIGNIPTTQGDNNE